MAWKETKTVNLLKQNNMKNILIHRSANHLRERSHDCHIRKYDDRIVNYTYKAYNAAEHFTVEIFDGTKWNHCLSMQDLGVMPDTGAYFWNESKRLEQANTLYIKAERIVKSLLNQ